MVVTAVGARPALTARPPAPRAAATLAVLLVATFMGQFDFFVVNVAAPSLRGDLHAGDVALELVVGGYAFAYAAGLVTGGRLGDLFGYRRMYVVGMLAFAATSLLCGLAASPAQLIVARLAQGLAAALMLPQVLGLITASVPAAGRPRATAWYGAASGLGGIAGQVLGGVLVTADVAGLGWRLIFLVNVPIGLVGAACGARLLPACRGAGRARLDPVGAAGFATALGLLLVPLTLGRSVHWSWWTWVSMAGGALVGLLTVHWQRVLTRRGADPLLDLRLLAVRSFRAGLVANFAFLAYFASFMFTLTLFSQLGLGLDALHAGLIFTPTAVLYTGTALVGHRLVARYDLRPVVVGAVVTATSLIALAVLVGVGGSGTSPVAVTLVVALAGPGNGLVLPSLIGASLREVTPAHAGAAAGALTTTQRFASSAGVAGVGTVFFAVAGTRAGAAGPTLAMTWSAVADAVLVLCVAAAVAAGLRGRRSPSSTEREVRRAGLGAQ